MNNKEKGHAAELFVAYDLIEKGWRVAFPFGDGLRYDLVAIKEKDFKLVQVKFGNRRNKNTLHANCCVNNIGGRNSYSEDDFDILAIYDPLEKECYYVSIKEAANRKSFSIRLNEKTESGQIENVHWSKDYKDFPPQ